MPILDSRLNHPKTPKLHRKGLNPVHPNPDLLPVNHLTCHKVELNSINTTCIWDFIRIL